MAAIPVRVEPPGENPVVEVSYDGQEVLFRTGLCCLRCIKFVVFR